MMHPDRLASPPLLQRLSPPCEAGLCITSLPWPDAPLSSLSLNGGPGGQLPLGAHPDTGHPRRALIFSDNHGEAPATALLAAAPSSSSAALPTASLERLAHYDSGVFAWEQSYLSIRQGGQTLGIAMGLRRGDAVHWWEACGIVELSRSEFFTEIEVGGSIACEPMSEDDFVRHVGYSNPYLHRHNWLSGHLYLRLYANGVCEVYAHHINNRFVDNGADLPDVVPVIGLRLPQPHSASLPELRGHLPTPVTLGGLRFDLSAVAPLSTADQPGKISDADGFLVLQPYTGAELFGGLCPDQITGDPFIYRAEQQTFPRGMARTLRFSFSLSDRSPVIARYIAPAYWYGHCAELLPEPLLPAMGALDPQLAEAAQWVCDNQLRGGFEDGSLPRHCNAPFDLPGRTRHEPGWEGEIPYAQFLHAWRTGDPAAYGDALRSAYYFTDVCIDHAVKQVRMHGYAPPALSLPMNRVQASIAAYLETGDPYLLEAARAVTATAHWQQKNSWPRMAVGRDACYLRSAVLLYRYFGDEFYRRIAYEGGLAVVQTQRKNGSFGDQGGGSGMHQWSGYISKPWMGLLALGGLLDYLELFPDTPPFEQAVRRFADWLMSERQERDGAFVWAYQHDYMGRRVYYNPINGEEIPLPTLKPWGHASMARLLGYCALRYDRPEYLQAWAESWEATSFEEGDHSVAAALQFLPWLQAKVLNARLTPHGVEMEPLSFPLPKCLQGLRPLSSPYSSEDAPVNTAGAPEVSAGAASFF